MILENWNSRRRKIFLDLENHHKDRFLRLANDFMVSSINELKEFEDVSELHWIG